MIEITLRDDKTAGAAPGIRNPVTSLDPARPAPGYPCNADTALRDASERSTSGSRT